MSEVHVLDHLRIHRTTSANSPFLQTVLFAVWYHRLATPELVIRLFERTHNHAACAYVALVGLFGLLSGIAPCLKRVSQSLLGRVQRQENIPWPIILDVVLLNLLDMMVALREVHPLRVLPCKVSDKTKWW
jgi:hypothetical protein